MKTLVITFFHVPWREGDLTGIQRRFISFLRALHQAGGDITLLHIVPQSQIEVAGPLDELSRSQSEFWGVPVRIALAPRRERRETAWNHYVAGMLSGGEQPILAPYGGAAVASAVTPFLDEGPDLVFAHRLPAMLPIMASGRRPRRLVLDFDDVEHRAQFRGAFAGPKYAGKYVRLLHLPALFALERRAAAAADLALVCSETDRAYLRRLGFGDTVQVVPNALPVPVVSPGVVGERTVLFIGDMKNAPNRSAAERLAFRIWPRVRTEVPDARLLIAGSGSDRLPSAGAGLPGVEHLGFVADLDALYAWTRVAACPIIAGGGTRLKLVEAASYARPMVSTPVGVEGLDFVDGVHALIRNDDAGFATACALLLRDDALCARLGSAGRAVMEAQYDVRNVERRIARMVENLVAAP